MTSFFTSNNILECNIAFKGQSGKSGSHYRLLSLFILLMLIIPSSKAQQDLHYAVQANIIYRFTKYIEWPNYNNTDDFIIGIVGETPLYNELEGFITNKIVGNRKIVIKKMPATLNSYNCHILFISEDYSRSLKNIAFVTKGSAILIITETNARAIKGSCINFIVVNEHLKLEINKTNIENRNLNIASELLRLGTVVK